MNKVISVPFAKIDDDARMVYGYASTADRDSEGEIITLEALKSALPGYMRFAAVREMHNAKAIGKTKEAAVDENGLYIGAKIIDNDAWKLIKNEVYSAFSVGGKVLERDETDPTIIKNMSLMEISLVDIPANPNCTIDLIKVADTSEDTDVVEVETETVEEAVEKKADAPADPDDDGDDDSSESDDNPDEDEDDADKPEDKKKPKAKKVVSIDSREDEVLYKRMLARFGQEKADEVFGKVQEVEPEPEVVEDTDKMAEALVADLYKDLDTAEKVDEIEFMAATLIADLYKDFDIDKITALQSTAKKEEVRQLLEFAKATKDLVAKAGSRHSRSDMDSLQAIHDHSTKMGAACADKETGIKAGDLSKAFEQVSKYKKLLNTANDTIDKLNKQVADKEDYIEKLKKTPKVPMPITTPAELPDGLIAVGKGGEQDKSEDDLNTDEKVRKSWRAARDAAFNK